jgi:drug/metabolite transporter (DMT)-like permease
VASGCAAVALALRSPASREARLRRSDAPRLLAMAGLGAVVGSVALAWGLQNTSGASASLMLTLEAVFTAVLAWYLYREVLDRRVVVAMALLTAGGAVLVIGQGLAGQAQMLGLLAVLIATAAWGRQRPVTRRC